MKAGLDLSTGLRALAVGVFLATAAIGAAGCGEDEDTSAADTLGEGVEELGEDIGDAVDDAADEIEDAVQ